MRPINTILPRTARARLLHRLQIVFADDQKSTIETHSEEKAECNASELIITATQIQIKSISGFFRFLRSVHDVKSQLATADGLLSARFRGTRTLTVWRGKESMVAFRNNGAHLDAMKSLKKIGKAKSVTWSQNKMPDWPAAIKKLSDVNF